MPAPSNKKSTGKLNNVLDEDGFNLKDEDPINENDVNSTEEETREPKKTSTKTTTKKSISMDMMKREDTPKVQQSVFMHSTYFKAIEEIKFNERLKTKGDVYEFLVEMYLKKATKKDRESLLDNIL